MTAKLSTRTSRAWTIALSLAAAGLLLPGVAQSQDQPAWEDETSTTSSRSNRSNDDGSVFSFRGSLGMTASPETFNMTFELPWAIDELVSVGPLFQLGFSDDNVLFGSTLQAYLTPTLDGSLEDWHPYAHMGMGLIYLEDDDRVGGRDDEDADFLFAAGAGVEYAVSESFFMGTGFLFDVIPAGAVGNRFTFGWQILTFRMEF